jgi:predicted outer membrane protein
MLLEPRSGPPHGGPGLGFSVFGRGLREARGGEMMGRIQVDPTLTMRTEVLLPIFPLEHRCSICAIYHRDPALFEELSQRLLLAHPRAEILAWLKQRRQRVTERALYRHYSKHVRPYISQVLEAERRVRAQIKALAGESQADIGAALSHGLSAQMLTALASINLPALLATATDAGEATGIVIAMTKLSDVLAKVEQAQAQIRLSEQLVELRRLEVLVKRGRAQEIAKAYIEAVLHSHPEIAEQVLALLDRAEPQPGMKQLKQLPSQASNDHSHRRPEKNSKTAPRRRR